MYCHICYNFFCVKTQIHVKLVVVCLSVDVSFYEHGIFLLLSTDCKLVMGQNCSSIKTPLSIHAICYFHCVHQRIGKSVKDLYVKTLSKSTSKQNLVKFVDPIQLGLYEHQITLDLCYKFQTLCNMYRMLISMIHALLYGKCTVTFCQCSLIKHASDTESVIFLSQLVTRQRYKLVALFSINKGFRNLNHLTFQCCAIKTLEKHFNHFDQPLKNHKLILCTASLKAQWQSAGMVEVPGSIPSQGPRHTKDLNKTGTSSSLVQHSTLKRFKIGHE